jgi:uncharacterized protein YqgC (DUF456 family)
MGTWMEAILEGIPRILWTAAVAAGCMILVALTVFRLPGTWLILAMAMAYDWWNDWIRLGPWWLGILAGGALLGEIVETVGSIELARRAGASRQAVWGAVIGGFVGMIFLSFLVPIPLLGTLIGAFAGCFAGAALVEVVVRERWMHGARVGVFAAVGFALGSMLKTGIAIAMSAILVAATLGPIR